MKKLALVLLCLLLVSPAAAQETPADRDALIDRLIAQLGSEAWREREQAQKELERIGEPALERLKGAAKSEDPERSSRARKIVAKVEKALRERRIFSLTERVLKTLRSGHTITLVEMEVYRKIAEIAVELRSSKDAPVVTPREAIESEPDKGRAPAGKIGEAWTREGASSPSRQLYRYRYSYREAVNLTLVLAGAEKGLAPLQKARLVYQIMQPASPEIARRLLELSMSENQTLRLTALMRLRQCAVAEHRDYFLRWLEDPQPMARQFAAEALAGLKLAGGVPEGLRKALGDKDYLVRRGAALALRAVEGETGAKLLIGLLRDKSKLVREAAATALARGPLEDVRAALLKALEDKSERVIACAARSLGKLKDTQSRDKIAALLDSQSLVVKKAAFDALIRTGIEKYLDKIVRHGSDTQHCWYAIEMLRNSAEALAYSALEKILAELEKNKSREGYRARALEAMLELNVEKTRARLLELFGNAETPARYKWQLIRMLRKCPDNAVLEALIEQLDSQDLNLQTQSLEALRYFTARELDSMGFRTLANDQQRKLLKKEWQKWWSQSKAEFSFEKAGAVRLAKMESLLSGARQLFSQGKYADALQKAFRARRLEPGWKETEELIRKVSFLQSIEREMKLRRKK